MEARGSVFKYGDNIDTDVIIPARYLNTQNARELADRVAMLVFGALPAKQPGKMPQYAGVTALPLYSCIVPVPPRQPLPGMPGLPLLLARRLGAVLGVPVETPLYIKRRGRPQKELTREERLRRAKAAFACRPGTDLTGKRVLLVDDIITTGATASACAAALLQAVTALLTANSYRTTEGLSILTGVAALGLFLALLGSRVMLSAVRGGYELLGEATDLQGAYRTRDKDLIRALARDLEQKDPWVLLSRPRTADEGFVAQSLDERAGERRAQKNGYILLGVALLSALLCLVVGRDVKLAAAALTAVLCMGAPLSSTLIAGMAALRLQRAAGAVGAVVPGWAAIQELGGIDTLQVDAEDLFAADSVVLEDIRIFKGGRIDRAILYAASVLNQSGGTLQGLFRQIIEDRTDILFPVKDLEQNHGLGFSAWCDNNRVLIGNRLYMEREGVPLPEQEYEDEHSQNGALQILYLAVSGNVHAMFVIRYVGGRNIARSLAALQQENIRLLVTSLDPSLTAKHITEAYRLPEGMVTLLDQEQCAALEAAPAEDAPCCMYHQKGFASLTGGLRAADKAQNAETTATTVQMVSVLFSVAIAVLLTSARSIWQLPVTYVLMYQAAWSALSIAVCALKQHN